MKLWNRISELLARGVTISYPNRFRTKAQMLDNIPADAHDLIAETSSCDSPQRVDRHDNCGACGSCVFRSLSLRAAGVRDDTNYALWPPQSAAFDPTDLLALQASRIRDALRSSDPWKALVQLQPTLRTAISHRELHTGAHEVAATIALLRRHVDEITLREVFARAV